MDGRGGKRSTSFKPGQSGNPGGKFKDPEKRAARMVLADVRAAAAEYTAEAIETLAEVMRNPKAPAVARLNAAATLLDRGHGKAQQTVTASVSVLDQLGLNEQRALLAALVALDDEEDGASGGAGSTH